ncbi:MAG: helix-turn-helix domain-containing protein [Bacteroidia bacterium]
MLDFYVKEWQYLLAGISVFLMNIGLLTGQKPYTPEYAYPFTESWRWKNIDALEGSGVQAIFEDSNGTLWVSTDDGIKEYDGYTWTTHLPSLTDQIIEITASSDGTLYAATPHDVFRYRGCAWKPFFSLKTSWGITIRSITATSKNGIMAATNAGVIQLSAEDSPEMVFYSASSVRKRLEQQLTYTHWVDLPESLLQGRDSLLISHVLEAADGTLWFAANWEGNEGKILRFRPSATPQPLIEEYQIFHSTPDFPVGPEQKIIQSRDGKIWIINGSFNLGISVFDGKTWKHIRLSDEVGGDEFTTDIAETEDGTIWFGAIGKVYAFKNNHWYTFKAPQYHVPANRIKFFSGKRNFWVFGIKSRVNRIDYSADRWATFPRLNFQCLTPDGKQWFIEADGRVVTEKDGIWTSWDTTSGLMDAPVKLIVTRNGQIWAGGSDKGVAATALFESGHWHQETHPKLSWGIDYRAMFEAEDGSLWFGSSVDRVSAQGHRGGAIQLLNPQLRPLQWVFHPGNANGLTQSNAYGIAQSKDGQIWLGGSNLFGFDGKRWTLPADTRLQSYINSLHSKDGFLVVGTRLYGVFTYDGTTWNNYNIDSGLTSNTIISVFVESDSAFWAVTEDNLCRFDGKNWTCSLFPDEMNIQVEGGTILRTDDGNIWVTKAPREWKRRALKLSKNTAGIFNEVISYRYSPENKHPETTIQPHNSKISPLSSPVFQWAGEDYQLNTPTHLLAFSYRLNQEEWSPFTRETSHTFSNLPTGSYTLEVRARDFDMNVDPSPAKIHFQVTLPLWQQNWAVFLTVFLLFVFLIFIFRITIWNRYSHPDTTRTLTDTENPQAPVPTVEPEIAPPVVPELTPSPVLLTSSDEKLLGLLSEIMEENLSDASFNVNKMCEMVNLSHMHFIRKVKQLTGMKPQEMLRSFRMKRARDLLSQNKLNIAEISYMVGYDLPNSFTRAFKKEFGVTPTEFIENIREEAD